MRGDVALEPLSLDSLLFGALLLSFSASNAWEEKCELLSNGFDVGKSNQSIPQSDSLWFGKPE